MWQAPFVQCSPLIVIPSQGRVVLASLLQSVGDKKKPIRDKVSSPLGVPPAHPIVAPPYPCPLRGLRTGLRKALLIMILAPCLPSFPGDCHAGCVGG